jgi:hypothetical protein
MVHATGTDDVDLDVWFAPPTAPGLANLEVKDLTVATTGGYLNGSWSGWDESKTIQQGLHLVQPRGSALVSVLYPRLHDQASPTLQSLADGKVIKVTSDKGTDYVFVSLKPFDYKDEAVSFSGTVGVIQLRGATVTLTLGAAGSIGSGNDKLQAQTPQSKLFTH